MKKLTTLVLVAMLLSFILASCGTPTPPHEHTFATGWTADANGHWHGATCEHTTEKADFAQHNDADGNGKCDACLYTLFTLDTVTVSAPDGVTVSENLTAQTGTDLVFTATVSNKYLLFADGADFVEKTVDGDTATYKFKVSAISENSEVTLTKEKYVFVEEIATGEGTYTDLVSGQPVYNELTISFDEAGTYYIYSDEGFIRFYCGVDEWGEDIYEQVYKAVVEEPGEITVSTRMYAEEDAEEFVYNYYVVEADTVIVMTDSATDYVLPSNVEVVLQYTAPEAGWYNITFDSEEYAYTSGMKATVYASSCGAIFEITAKVPADELSEFAISYTISWNVEQLVPTTVQVGENNLTFQSNSSVAITFTATEAGAYSFVLTLDSNTFKYWDFYEDFETGEIVGYLGTDYSNIYITKYLAAGETVDLLIANTMVVYNEETEEFEYTNVEITDILTITNIGYAIDTEYEYTTGIASTNGSTNSLYNSGEDTATYYVSVGEGVVIVVDGEEYTSYDFTIEANATVYFTLKTESAEATEVNIVAKQVVYEIYTSFGTNYAEDLIPGKTYTLVINEMLGMGTRPLIFAWENEDISFFINGDPIVSGEAFNYYPGYPITVVNNGTEECSASFEFIDPTDIGDLVIGTNSIKVSIVNYFAQSVEINFTIPGTYVLTPAADEENLVVWYNGEEATLPLEFTVNDGETATFGISTSANVMTETEDVVDFTIECKELPDVTYLDGEYAAMFSNMTMMSFNFIPVEGKTYGTVEITDFNTGDFTGTYKYALTSLSGLALWNSDNDPVEFLFSLDMGGNWTVQPPMFRFPMTLTKVEENSGDGETSGFNGTLVPGANAVNANGSGVPAVVNTPGEYTLSYADGETNGFIVIEDIYGSEMINLPYSFTVSEGETVTFVILTKNWMEDTIDLILTKEEAEETPSNALVLGENAVKVTVQNYFCAGVDMTFTATEAGTYVIKAAVGEENAEVFYINIEELIDLPYEFTLEAGQTATFNICTSAIMTLTEDTIDLIIEKVA